MRPSVRALSIALLLVAVYVGWRAFVSTEEPPTAPSQSSRRAATEPQQPAPAEAATETVPAPTPVAPAPTRDAHEQDHVHDHGDDEATAEDSAVARENRELVEWLAENPLSNHPHEVLQAWGGRPGAAGPIGVVMVVDESLATPTLEQIVRDSREKYADAVVFAIKIYDTHEAATYDRHSDGGALAELHLVAHSARDVGMELDTIEIRGVSVEP